MELHRWADTLSSLSTQGRKVRDWSLYYTENQRLSLGIKDRLAGSAHTPLALAERCSMRYLFVWDDGKVSRGSLERAQLDGPLADVLSFARGAAFEDPDAAHVRGSAPFPEVDLYSQDAADIAAGKSDWIATRLEAVRSNRRARETLKNLEW